MSRRMRGSIPGPKCATRWSARSSQLPTPGRKGVSALILLLSQDADPEQRAAVMATLARLDVSVSEIQLGERAALVVQGVSPVPSGSLARIAGIERVVSVDTPAPLAAATKVNGDCVVRIGDASFGGGYVSVIAGPCTIEDGAMLRRIALDVRAAGATVLRGGAFKVRTSPHAYQGRGKGGLADMKAVASEVGLPYFTELTDPRQVAELGDDISGVQIGARHMQNVPLLREAAALGKPVLLKRHMGADVEELLLSAEYILEGGNDQIILCERGIRAFGKHVRYTLDIGAIPWLKARVGLPVVVDPSHAAGHHTLVPSLGRAAIAAGADGLIVEVHPEPETTRCDAAQALSPVDFAQLMRDVRVWVEHDGRTLCGAVDPHTWSAGGARAVGM